MKEGLSYFLYQAIFFTAPFSTWFHFPHGFIFHTASFSSPLHFLHGFKEHRHFGPSYLSKKLQWPGIEPQSTDQDLSAISSELSWLLEIIETKWTLYLAHFFYQYTELIFSKFKIFQNFQFIKIFIFSKFSFFQKFSLL